MDGFKVAIVLREVPATKDLPVIILTGSTLPEDEIVGQRVGAKHYMTKPYALSDLLARIQACLATK